MTTPTLKPVTRVVHCEGRKVNRSNYVYIGRPSKWGNPFVIGQHGNRDRVIELYGEWLRAKPELVAALPELVGKELGCWCRPKACHGDVLIKLLKEKGLI